MLQDIPTLNGQDSSQLEEWLTDIEMASELTGESRTKLAQASSLFQIANNVIIDIIVKIAVIYIKLTLFFVSTGINGLLN